MHDQRYLQRCPIGCDKPVEQSDIFPGNTCLERCTGCDQLFSQCTEKDFESSMEEFNTANGTWPPPENVRSLERSTKKTLQNIAGLTGRDIAKLKLLDVGCSNGAFIFTARQFGIRGEGVEPAKEAASAAQKAGLEVHHGYLEELGLPDASYDIITLFEVIEHLKHPIKLLKECHRILKKDGVMVIRTANTDSWTVKWLKGKWHYFNISRHGGHISFFCRKSITTLCRLTRFKVVRLNTHSVTLCEPEGSFPVVYRCLKIIAEGLNLPAKLCGKGQELEVYLKKR